METESPQETNGTMSTMGARARTAVFAAAQVAAKGLPAIRAAMHGARLGAGRALSPAAIERLGMSVVPESARTLAARVGQRAGEAALVLRRGGGVLRASTTGLTLQGKDGVSLRVSRRGAAAIAVSRDAVGTVARMTARGAMIGIGRATMRGAISGAILEGGIAGVTLTRAVRSGAMDKRAALRQVALYAARGAVAGAVGVAAAGVVSAGIVATGVALTGAPVAIPIATMLAAGALTSHWFDRSFGTH